MTTLTQAVAIADDADYITREPSMMGKPDFYQIVVLALIFWLAIGIAAACLIAW